MIEPPDIADQILTENFKFKIQSEHGKMIEINGSVWTWKDDWLHLVTYQSLSENLKFKINRWHGKIIDPPNIVPTKISIKIWNLRFSLDMERSSWYHQPVTHWKF